MKDGWLFLIHLLTAGAESVSGQPIPAGVLLAVSRDKPHHENGRVHPAIDAAEIL